MIPSATEAAINQLHARYIDAVWRKDTAAFAQCWTANARWRIAGLDVRTRAAIAETFETLTALSLHIAMWPGALALDTVSATTATGRLLVSEFVHRADAPFRTIGLYHDRYEQTGPTWSFADRHWQFGYRGTMALTDAMHPREDFGPPPGMPTD